MSSSTPTNVQCAHCKEPVPAHLVREGQDSFCCTGCEAIYHALGEAGLNDFYRYQDIPISSCPVPTAPREGNTSTLSTEEFLRHAKTLEDETHQITLHLDGVHCAGCVWLLEKMPSAIDHVLDAKLELSSGRLVVRWSGPRENLSHIISWLLRFGYTSYPTPRSREQADEGAMSEADKQLLRRVGVTWALAGNIMLVSVAHYSGLSHETNQTLAVASSWLNIILATLAMIYGADIFLRRAWLSITQFFTTRPEDDWYLSMDVPLSLGLALGWGYSVWAAASGRPDMWFDSLTMLIAALLTSRWVQRRAGQHARRATAKLMSLLPQSARRIAEDGSITLVDIDELQTGDLVQVRMGDVLPADGIIRHGESHIHRGVLTGESKLESVSPGARIEAGVTNIQAPIQVEIQAVGQTTRVGRLMNWIEERAQTRTPELQTYEKLGGWFVAAVLVATILTGIFWSFVAPEFAVPHMIAVLVVSCPCALSMATPLALAVFVGRAARRGLFIKHDDVIESIHNTTHVIFDKTGTLTSGDMRVRHWHGDDATLMRVAALEEKSAHPIARALCSYASSLGITTTEQNAQILEEIAGCGIRGEVDGHTVVLGKMDWVRNHYDTTQQTNASILENLESLAEQGATPVVVSIDGMLCGAFAVGDQIQKSSQVMLSKLRAQNIKTILLSGDHPKVVQNVGKTLGFSPDDIHGGITPEEKQQFVSNLRNDGDTTIVMIGDGVNDAAAMQEAHVGIAVHGSAQASLVAADVFSTKSQIGDLLELFEGSRHTLRLINRNLIISALYNATTITLAAMGFITPLAAAILMPISSILIVFASWFPHPFPETNSTPKRPKEMHEDAPPIGSSSIPANM